MKKVRITESQLRGLVKRMIKEATVNDLFPMDDDVRKAFFTKDMETMGNEKIQQLLDYVNEYENYCVEKLQSAISLNKEERKRVISNLFNQMNKALQENQPMQDRRTYDKGKGAISRVLRGITDGLEYLVKITLTLSEDKHNTFYNTPRFSDYDDYSLSEFIDLYNQRIDENIKIFIDSFNFNNIISKDKSVQNLVKECIKDYELNFYQKFSQENAREESMQKFTKLIIQKRPNLRERIGMGNTTISESQLRGIVRKMIKEEVSNQLGFYLQIGEYNLKFPSNVSQETAKQYQVLSDSLSKQNLESSQILKMVIDAAKTQGITLTYNEW